ncbi:MAG: NUDIX hydrolase [Candidatus Omnitrophota bacterium]
MGKIKDTHLEVLLTDPKSFRSDCVIDLSFLTKIDSSLPLEERERLIRNACRDILRNSTKAKHKIVVISPVEIKDFPLIGFTRIVTQEIHRFLTRETTSISHIAIMSVDKKIFEVFQKEVSGYLNHLLKTLAGEPYCTVDVIIELPKGIVIIERSNPPFGWALPGGFVDRDESLETAVRREAMEETHLELKDLRQFHTYSDPSRDPRFHTIDTVFIAKGEGMPKSGDDAKNLKVVAYEDLLKGEYAFDHKQIIKEYLKQRSN